jgi:DNA-binding NarL/FixJ family response regulator
VDGVFKTNRKTKAVDETPLELFATSFAWSMAAGAQGKEACFMDSVRMNSLVEIERRKSGRGRLLNRVPTPTSYEDAKPSDATAGAIVDQAASESSAFESASRRSGSFRCVDTSEKNRLRDRLWAREEPTEVVIVDGDAATRFLLQRILEQCGDYRCVGCYTSGEEALREVPGLHPRIVLMDIQMSGISGIECMRRLKGKFPGLIVVLVSELTDPETMWAALAAGGDGYLTKPFAVAQCLATVRFSVRRYRSAPADGGEIHRRSGEVDHACLTDREHHVMSCLAKGLLYKEIADELSLSFSTVHKLQHRIFLKLRVTNRTEAVTKWRNGNGG